MAEWAGIYKTGLATVAANGTTVTFQNAGNIANAIRPGDRFGVHVGLAIRITAMVGNVATLAQPWPGPTQAAAAYEIALTPYDSGYRQQLQVLLDRYGASALGLVWSDDGWVLGETYLADTALEHNGSSYRAVKEHTASATSEPGVGADWQQFWRILAEAGDLSPEDRAFISSSASAASAAAETAIEAASQTEEDQVATAADRDQTGRDRAAIAGATAATAADRVQTGLDRDQTMLDAEATAADRVQTGLDRSATGQDRSATAADREQTGEDRTATGQDAAATAADRVQTALDRAATAGAVEATGADRLQTGLDRAAAAASAQEAADLLSSADPELVNARFISVEGDVATLESVIGDKADQSVLQMHVDDESNPHSVTKAQVGLGEVDNTPDAQKPVSEPQQEALSAKADLVAGKVPLGQLPDIGSGDLSRSTRTTNTALTKADQGS